MAANQDRGQESSQEEARPSGLAVALTVAAIAALGAGIAYAQLKERRLSKLERTRLRFYRYLRERGHLES